MTNNNAAEAQIQLEVLKYLHENPDALDTAEGICQWWLNSAHTDYASHRVQLALDRLAADGFICKEEMDDGQAAYYRCKADNADGEPQCTEPGQPQIE